LADVFTYILLVLEIILLLPLAYLLTLTVAGLFYRTKTTSGERPVSRLAVLVPAHNEETLLPRLMESIGRTDYPHTLLQVFIVADNCTDGTTKAAAEFPCAVFERHDDELIGKGHALEWLLGRIKADTRDIDAFVFIDADCEVTPNFFSVIDSRFQRGERAVQVYNTTANPTETWVSSLRHLALILMHHTRLSGREVLGLSCGIFGTGFALHRSVIEQFGWHTHGLAEDVEYFMQLTENGIRVSYAREAQVLSGMPSTLRASKTQNERWERGRLAVARRYFVPFVLGGLKSLSPIRVDAGMQQIVPPLSLVGLASIVLLIASLLTGNRVVTSLGIAAVTALALHAAIGIAAARPPLKAVLALAYVPWYAVWKVALYARSMMPGSQRWIRTERPD
jgi:1,2-diacylglycerol 3-beta-glucosyltransferase